MTLTRHDRVHFASPLPQVLALNSTRDNNFSFKCADVAIVEEVIGTLVLQCCDSLQNCVKMRFLCIIYLFILLWKRLSEIF